MEEAVKIVVLGLGVAEEQGDLVFGDMEVIDEVDGGGKGSNTTGELDDIVHLRLLSCYSSQNLPPIYFR